MQLQFSQDPFGSARDPTEGECFSQAFPCHGLKPRRKLRERRNLFEFTISKVSINHGREHNDRIEQLPSLWPGNGEGRAL